MHFSKSLIVRGKSSVFKWNCANFDTFMKLGMVEDIPKDWEINGRQVWKSIIFQLLMTSSIDIQKNVFRQNTKYYISIDSSIDTD